MTVAAKCDALATKPRSLLVCVRYVAGTACAAPAPLPRAQAPCLWAAAGTAYMALCHTRETSVGAITSLMYGTVPACQHVCMCQVQRDQVYQSTASLCLLPEATGGHQHVYDCGSLVLWALSNCCCRSVFEGCHIAHVQFGIFISFSTLAILYAQVWWPLVSDGRCMGAGSRRGAGAGMPSVSALLPQHGARGAMSSLSPAKADALQPRTPVVIQMAGRASNFIPSYIFRTHSISNVHVI